MRRPLLITLLVTILAGNVQQVFAYGRFITNDQSVRIGNHRFGFVDWAPDHSTHRFGFTDPEFSNHAPRLTKMYFGPLGECKVPFTATQGLIGIGAFAGLLIFLMAIFVARKWTNYRRLA